MSNSMYRVGMELVMVKESHANLCVCMSMLTSQPFLGPAASPAELAYPARCPPPLPPAVISSERE